MSKSSRSPTYDISVALGDGKELFLSKEYKRSIDHFKLALELSRKSGKNKRYEAEALLRMGDSYYLLERYNKAIDAYKEALDISIIIKDESIEEGSLLGLVHSYESLGDKEKEIEHRQKLFDES